MQFIRILQSADPHMGFIQQLYEETFVLPERRDWDVLLMFLADMRMHLELVQDSGNNVGFIIWWELPACRFIEHFAISSSSRGKQYGSRILERMRSISKQRLVLEVAPPLEEADRRRIRFYEKAGLNCCFYQYIQPPYHTGDLPHEMIFMSDPVIDDEPMFLKITRELHRIVYQFGNTD